MSSSPLPPGSPGCLRTCLNYVLVIVLHPKPAPILVGFVMTRLRPHPPPPPPPSSAHLLSPAPRQPSALCTQPMLTQWQWRGPRASQRGRGEGGGGPGPRGGGGGGGGGGGAHMDWWAWEGCTDAHMVGWGRGGGGTRVCLGRRVQETAGRLGWSGWRMRACLLAQLASSRVAA